jgi:hypothetical protein
VVDETRRGKDKVPRKNTYYTVLTPTVTPTGSDSRRRTTKPRAPRVLRENDRAIERIDTFEIKRAKHGRYS